MTNVDSSRFYFDFLDPLSHLVELELREVERTHGGRVARVPFELRPPPAPMLDPGAEAWRTRWDTAARAAEAREARLPDPPALIPWTRKAHELVLIAEEQDLGSRVRRVLFERAFDARVDIGRIDVLVAIAVELGMDETETKATLDVDRHTPTVERARTAAEAEGVRAPPTLVFAGRKLEGFHNADEIVSFLDFPSTPAGKG